MMISDFRFQISDLRPRISDSNLESEIRNLKLCRRRGVTILEVLFAIMVTTVGLFAALTLLPMGAMVAKKARNAEASNTAVTAAVGNFDSRGMRKPSNWIAYNWGTGQPVYPWTEFQNNLAPWFNGSQSLCIDPRMIAANLQYEPSTLLVPPGLTIDTTVTPNRAPASTFPRGADARPLTNEPFMWRLTLWNGRNGLPVPPQVPPRVPVPPPLPLSKLMSDSLFVFDDDLNYDRAADASLVASQAIDYLPGAATTPARRQKGGHLSWMATITPKMDRYTGLTMNTSPLVNTYVLSVVVFYDRPAGLAYNADPLNERVLNVRAMPGGGVTGSEVLLETVGNPVDQQDADKQLNIHSNEWIMLMGTLPSVQVGVDTTVPANPVPVSTDPLHVFKWYRVSHVEAEVTWPGSGNPAQRYVTLVGQDWDTNTVILNTTPQLVARAVAMEGIAAVMERTIRLEQ